MGWVRCEECQGCLIEYSIGELDVEIGCQIFEWVQDLALAGCLYLIE